MYWHTRYIFCGVVLKLILIILLLLGIDDWIIDMMTILFAKNIFFQSITLILNLWWSWLFSALRTRSLPQRRSSTSQTSSTWRRRWSASGSATADRKRNVLTPTVPPLPCPANPSPPRTTPPATARTWYDPACALDPHLPFRNGSCMCRHWKSFPFTHPACFALLKQSCLNSYLYPYENSFYYCKMVVTIHIYNHFYKHSLVKLCSIHTMNSNNVYLY